MRVARLILSFVLILISSPLLNSQQSITTPQRDPKALAIIGQTISAVDPQASRLSTTDTYTVGTLRVLIANPPVTKQVTIKSKGSRQVRTELTGLDGTTIRIVNNRRGIIQTPDGKTRTLIGNNLISRDVSHLL